MGECLSGFPGPHFHFQQFISNEKQYRLSRTNLSMIYFE
ncbi:hypothetical protein KNP414_02264 [Paenibacillus mucilaginosus KNP414]|uniref:Uncharacterized protein n=1 Tax=Paenibacillus mucilaginosus (strain KNP414) TaxID=1036673 RepID=F8F7S1_PAEMK|nr:hypothetical protein KNP414_02264 [Paenibacillus mucilaginosus KNP414]